MKKQLIHLIILITWVGSTLFTPFIPVVEAQLSNQLYLSPDLDGDGLSNVVEENGWCNAIGCFQTNPSNPDTDNDGLTDGEENLYVSDPTSSASPGIYILYDDNLKTQEYYPWQPYGNQLIARGDTFNPPRPDERDQESGHATDLDAAVIRRGSTFFVGGPFDETLTIEKSIGSLTTLPQIKDPYSGRWQVTVPSNATVGKYTLNMGDKSLDLFVLFELPAPSGALSQLGVEKFLYDDDPSKLYDEQSILVHDYRYPGDPRDGQTPPYTVPAGEEVSQVHSYDFTNDQYKRFILEDYVIEIINGRTTVSSAAGAIATGVDALTIFRNPRPLTSSWRVLNPGINPRQQCSNIGGLLSAFNRVAGIPSRPVMVDWSYSTFDHATEVWIDNAWRVYRGYRTYEMAAEPDDTPTGCTSNWPACGTTYQSSQSAWGRYTYRPWHSGGRSNGNVIMLADENWTSEGQAFRWASWDLDRILLAPAKLTTLNAQYWGSWGWTQEPVDYGSPTSWPDLPPDRVEGVTLTPSTGRISVEWEPVSNADFYNIYYMQRGDSWPYYADKKYYDEKITNVTSPYVINSLIDGEPYNLVVIAESSTGESPESLNVETIPLAIPAGVYADAGDAQVTLNWEEVIGATGYNIYYQAGSTVNTASATLLENVSSPEVVTLLTNGQEYAFAVVATRDGGESDLSEVITATPLPPVPAAPANISAEAGNAQVTVSWDNVDGATSYNLYYEAGSTVSQATGTLVENVTSPETVLSLTNGQQYAFAVTAGNLGGESGLSSIVTSMPLPSTPGVPANVSAGAGNAQVTVSWNSVSGATSYNLYYRAGSTVSKATGTLIADVTSPEAVLSLTNGTQYAFAVAAENLGGESALSAVVTSIPTPPPPAAPTGIVAQSGNEQVTVTWNTVSGATSYNLYYREGSTVSKVTGTLLEGVTSPEVVALLTNGTQYAFAVAAVGSGGESDLSGIAIAIPEAPAPLFAASAESLRIGQVAGESHIDSNGNGQYDQLILDLEVDSSQSGQYWVMAELSAQGASSDPNVQLAGGLISVAVIEVELTQGPQTVELIFGGTDISSKRTDGPYELSGVWITDVENPGPTEFMNDSLSYQADLYATQAYQSTDFETQGALLSGSYKHHVVDTTGDGNPDAIVISTGIDIYQPETYTVRGSLYDGQDAYIGTASWTGTGAYPSLQFENVEGTVGPYTLRDLDLSNAAGEGVDYIAEAYAFDRIPAITEAGLTSFNIYSAADKIAPLGETITPTNVITEALVGGDLVVGVEVDVSQAGSYKLEGWLVDGEGNLLTWSQSEPVELSAGKNTMALPFEGSLIRARGVDGPYGLVALKVLSGSDPYEVLDEIRETTLTTAAYDYTDFAAGDAVLVFEDFFEDGTGSWVVGSDWAVSEAEYHSSTRSIVGTDTTGALRLASPLDLSEVLYPAMRIQMAGKLGASGDTGYVEISTNGTTWDILATYAEDMAWTTYTVDLSSYGALGPNPGESTVYLRFRLDSEAGAADDRWYIDDVLVAGIPDTDDDGDGIPNLIEGGSDPDKDGMPNYRDDDSDGDGLYDVDEGIGDPDGDGIPNFLDLDSDGDGASDAWETQYGFDPYDAADGAEDADEDGLSNAEEYNHETDPYNDDSDGDLLTDGEEVNHPTNPTDPNNPDSDGDDLNDGEEVNSSNPTNPADPDSDDDGVNDGDEIANGNGTDPNNPDSDEDGLNDGDEILNGTDPNDDDSDDDTVRDGAEITNGTNPNNPDSDEDGLNDGQEAALGTDPNLSDSDGDGLPDKWEVDYGTGPMVPDADADPDDDGLNNQEEFEAGTDPNDSDSDDDGLTDGDEVNGPNPTDPNDRMNYHIFLPIVTRN